MFDRKTNTLTRYSFYKGEPPASPFGITAVLEDRNDTLWLATYGAGLLKFDREREIVQRLLSSFAGGWPGVGVHEARVSGRTGGADGELVPEVRAAYPLDRRQGGLSGCTAAKLNVMPQSYTPLQAPQRLL